MRSFAIIASLATAVLCGPAFAQDVTDTYPSDPYYEEHVRPAPRVYQYRSDSAPIVRIRPASCGEFRYWDGNRCVDARFDPPDVR